METFSKREISRVTTPREITLQIHELCQCITENAPVFIPVNPAPGSLINECFPNVDAYIKKNGGQKILGWSIWQRANVLIEAEAHAVWESPTGETVDITPHSNEESSILFLADPQMTYNGNWIPNIRRALTSSPLAAELIKLYNERDQIGAGTTEKTYSLPSDMLLHMIEIDRILNQKVGRNDLCPCQSSLKYKKCCGKYEI